MNLLDLMPNVEINRKAACHGGEYCSPCPFCKEGNDRFLIWPNRHNKNGEYRGGRYFCRICDKYGDAISFLIALHGINYVDACKRLELNPKKQQSTRKIEIPYKPLSIVADPPTTWIQKATAFTDWCHLNLMKNPNALKQIQARGFTQESIKKFKIGFNPGDSRGYDFKHNRKGWGLEEQLKNDGTPKSIWLPVGYNIPTLSNDGQIIKLKIRRTAWKDEDKLPKYVEISGSKPCPSIYGNTFLPFALVSESELDGLLIQQEAADLVYCIALGGSTKPIDADTYALLKRTKNILFVPDFDKAGFVAWCKWKKIFPQMHRILTPAGKSPGDAYLRGINIREWILEGMGRISNEK